MAEIDERAPACVAWRWDAGKVSKTIPLLTEWVQAIRAQSCGSSSKILAGGKKWRRIKREGEVRQQRAGDHSGKSKGRHHSHTRISLTGRRATPLWSAFIWMSCRRIAGPHCSGCSWSEGFWGLCWKNVRGEKTQMFLCTNIHFRDFMRHSVSVLNCFALKAACVRFNAVSWLENVLQEI